MGPKSDFTYTVMRVTASYDGTVYLRGREYNIYNGTAWESSGGRKETFPAGSDILGNLTIHTSGLGNVMYIPYYSTEEYPLADGFVKNSGNTKKYSFTAAKNPVGIASDVSACTELPHETYAWASVLVEGIDTGQPGKAAGAQSIAAYVRNSASYALSPPVMDTAYNDFAEWFLTESDTGYCVHFATAAAVLLRAAGISARYVEGYMISCQAGEQITVTNQDAHAWVEYYDSDANVWRILEATPADAAVSDVPAETEGDTAETEAPAPEQTPEQSPEGQKNEEDVPDTGKTENADGNSGTGTTGNAEITGAGTGNPDGMGGNAAGTGEKIMPEEPLQIPAWVKNLVWIPAALAVIPVQGNIRIAIKRRIWNRGTPNEAALVRWKQSVRLARLTKTKLPGELDALALKAKFSQHTLTGQELDAFSVFRQQILDTVNRMPWYRRYFLRWILAVG